MSFLAMRGAPLGALLTKASRQFNLTGHQRRAAVRRAHHIMSSVRMEFGTDSKQAAKAFGHNQSRSRAAAMPGKRATFSSNASANRNARPEDAQAENLLQQLRGFLHKFGDTKKGFGKFDPSAKSSKPKPTSKGGSGNSGSSSGGGRYSGGSIMCLLCVLSCAVR